MTLRTLFGADETFLLQSSPQSARLSADFVITDVAQFLGLLDEAKNADKSTDKERALARAVRLYRGDLLIGYPDIGVAKRSTYSQRFETALRDLAKLHQARCDFAGAEESLQRLLSYNPLLEEAHVDLIRAYADSGQPGKVRRQYATLKETLRKELNAAPTDATRQLVQELLHSTPISPAPRAVPHELVTPAANAEAEMEAFWREATSQAEAPQPPPIARIGARLNTKSYGTRIVYKPLDFTIDGVTIGSARTLATGTATAYLTPAFGAGTHSVVASFAGDRLYKPSSKTFTITITPAATSIVAAKAALYCGVAANLKATLTRKTDNGHPANVEVLFKIDGAVIGSAITDGTGTAILSYAADTTFSIGSHNLTAEFAGDANHNGSASSAVALTISKNKTTLTQGNVSRAAGSKVTLSATLKQSVGKIPQSGKTITFSVDGMVVGTGVTNASGVATYTYTVPSTASLGVHPLAVSFDEDDYNLASVYSAATLTVK